MVNKLPATDDSQRRQALADALHSLQSPQEINAFLHDLTTPAELAAMADRWHVAKLLNAGETSYRAIHGQTGVSVTTIGRVARFLQNGAGGYRMVLSRLTGVATALLLLSGCAANQATGGNIFNALSQQQERDMGEQSARTELERYGLYRPQSEQTRYVTNLCRRMWGVVETAGDPVSCVFIDSGQFNAWATPGYINVYRGLLPYVQNEAQLAAIIGHEAGHITAQHVAQHASKQMVLSTAASLGAIAVGLTTRSDNLANAAYALGGAAGGMALMSYSRADELQADELGVRYLARAGYDPREAVSMLQAMQNFQNSEDTIRRLATGGQTGATDILGSLFKSHPNTPDRRSRARDLTGGEPDGQLTLPAGVNPAVSREDPAGVARYHQAINGLAYGPQRRDGIAGRRYLAMPRLFFVLKLPDGYVLRHQEAAKKDAFGLWYGAEPATGTRLSVQVASHTAGLNVAYALENAIPSLKGRLHPLDVDGVQAFSGFAQGQNPQSPDEQQLVIGIPVLAKNALVIVTYTFPTLDALLKQQDAILQRTAASRFLTEERTDTLQPLSIITAQTTAETPVATLANDLPQGAFRTEWFRTLNGLAPDIKALPPGAWYKTVSDTNPAKLP